MNLFKFLFLFLLFTCKALCQIKSDTINIQTILACRGNEWNVEKPIREDWVSVDVENVKKLNQLYFNSKSIADVGKIFPSFLNSKGNCRSDTYDCGYNLKSTIHEVYGGYGSVHISALYFDDKIIKLRFTIDMPGQIVFNNLSSNIEFPLECKYGLLSCDKIIEENLKDYELKFGTLSLEINDKVVKKREVFSFFTDVLSGSTFKKPFYILHGLDYPIFDYIRYFVVLNDIETLQRLIYSPSPTARLLIANALIYLEKKGRVKIEKKASLRIKEILTNSEIVQGGVLSCWSNKFKYDFYDITNNFDKYMIEK